MACGLLPDVPIDDEADTKRNAQAVAEARRDIEKGDIILMMKVATSALA